jgi:ABC-2 type transport system permease protein
MRAALRAEWAKTWSQPGLAWLLGALVIVSVGISAITITTSKCAAAGCGQDPARLSLSGVYVGQAVAALAGVLAIGGEYGTGMIRVSLAAVPRRGRLLAAKTAVLTGPVLTASVLAVAASMAAGTLILPGHGFTAAHGFDLLGWPMWRAALCAVAYLTLVALLGFGVTTAVRDSAAGTGAVLGLLYLFPLIAAGQTLQRRLDQIGPMPAGLDSQSTIGLATQPLTPWQGLGVVAAWAACAVAAGGLVLRLRDA